VRYRLSVSSAEAAARIRGAVLGEYWESRHAIRKPAAKEGFYGTTEQEKFEIFWSDGGMLLWQRQTPIGFLRGYLQQMDTGCALAVTFRIDPLIWFLAAFFGVGVLAALMIAIHETEARTFALLWIAAAAILSFIFAAIFREARSLNFKKLETLFSDCIIKKEKK